MMSVMDQEVLQVRQWRAEQAERAGLPQHLARSFADGSGDVRRLVAAIEAGCDLQLAFDIFHEPTP